VPDEDLPLLPEWEALLRELQQRRDSEPLRDSQESRDATPAAAE
jgi:hypothetical protein